MTDKTLRTSEEAVQRMENLVRKMAATSKRFVVPGPDYGEAASIVAMLPDPYLIEARKIAEGFYPSTSQQYLDGLWDHHPTLQGILSGIKRGRELASQENNND